MTIHVLSAIRTIVITGFINLVFCHYANAEIDMSKNSDCRMRDQCSREQGSEHHSQKNDPRQHIVSLLGLRNDQKSAVLKVLDEAHEKRMQTRNSSREQHRALHTQVLKQLEPLLDDEQMSRFISFSEEMKKRHQQQKSNRKSQHSLQNNKRER